MQIHGGAMDNNGIPPAAEMLLARKCECLAKQRLSAALPDFPDAL
jgi:hypothetical protein